MAKNQGISISESFKSKLDLIISTIYTLLIRTSQIERLVASFYNKINFRRMPLKTQQPHTSMLEKVILFSIW